MISNLPDDVVRDLLRDLNTLGYGFDSTKQIIETWEANRDKYLADIDRGRVPTNSDYLMSGNSAQIEWYKSLSEGHKLPNGSGFIVP